MNRDALYKALVSDPRMVALQKSAPVDAAATGIALAKVESNFDELAVGDDGQALGLWQFNTRVRSVDQTRLSDVGYQIGLFVALFTEISGMVDKALALVRKRTTAGETFNFDAARDLPQWWNIGWQFGSGALWLWLASANDYSAQGFADYRTFVGKPIDSITSAYPYTRRTKSFRAAYDTAVADAPSFWTVVVVGSVASAAKLPGEATQAVSDAVSGAVDAGKKAVNDSIDATKNSLTSQMDALFAWVKHEIFIWLLAAVGTVVVIVALVWFSRKYLAAAAKAAVVGAA